ncbi:MAG: recombinase family protein [Chloroflexota bacterium]
MPSKKPANFVQRSTALCYVRLSLTRDESDLNSPERQRANIRAECERRGWTPEWYEDVEGHKSGTEEDNRPGWLALKERLSDADIIAVVANDLSRLHRKGWRIGSLIDFLEQHNVGLVLAAPGRNLDLSGSSGKITTMIMALMDEYYATDTSQKQKDSVQYRRGKGIIVGPIPFGTMRDKEGYLLRSVDGVWLLPDGIFLEGKYGEAAPDEKALWRGFAEAAHRCLVLFSEGRHGRRKIAELLNVEGYRYRNSESQTVLFESDDIRRIAANWVEYGGGIVPGKAKDRRARDVNPETVILHPERAVFEVELCTLVGHIRKKRSRNVKQNPDYAVRLDATVYPLSKLVYCAHCNQIAKETEDNTARSYLTGKTGNNLPARRYRHDTERRCPAHNRSVKADLLERDFLYLLESLTVNPDSLPILAQALERFNRQNRPEEQVSTIQAEIAHWRQRAKNADMLFAKARISEEDWQAAITNAEHEITRLQTQIAQHSEAELALQLTMEMVANLVHNWQQANAEMRRAFASSLFEYLVYDLDARQIVDFKLKPWVELLMQLKITFQNDKNLPSESSEIERVLWCP